MMFVVGAEQIINTLGAVLVIVLGGFVASVRPRRRGNLAFALFCVAFGLSIGATNVLVPDRPVIQGVVWSTAFLFAFVQMGALVALARHVPATPERTERRLIVAAGFVATAYFVLWSVVTWISLDDLAAGFLVHDRVKPVFFLGGLAQGAAIGVWVGYLAFLALRVNSTPGVSEVSYRTLAAGLLIFPATFHGLHAGMLEPSLQLLGWPFIAWPLALAGIWLIQSGRGHWPRTCRNLALFALALPLGGMLYTLAGLPGGYGVARTLSVIVFAYAILSGQLLGIDVKVRWTISKSTIAAAFVTAFFVAGEGAQILFGQRNEWVGLVAAGTLVFAIAPLQRAAERLAERAVPVVPRIGANGSYPSESSFRKAVRLALRDRRLTRDEEGHLHELARDLGLDGARAHAIMAEIEQEASS